VTTPVALEPHFFRHESGRLVAALVRVFGPHNLALAEDVAQDALVRALEVWKLHGVPEQPSAWLLAAAKNKAIDALRRERTKRTYAPELTHLLDSEWTMRPAMDEAFDARAMRDDELRMMFQLCQPSLPDDVQVALVLHLVSGLGATELASVFFVSHAAMEKRLVRGKHALAEVRSLLALDDAAVMERLGAVQSAIYLLFNEGYHGASDEAPIREELCREGLRLVTLLAEHERTGTPSTLALAALLCLHAARLPARVGTDGQLLAFFDQDRARWDRELIARGHGYLERSAEGDAISEYHLEAAIAMHQSFASSREDTPWDAIVMLYDRLLDARGTPVVALSRAIAIGERDGPEAGLAAIEAIEGSDRLAAYPFYEAAIGELTLRSGRGDRARPHFEAAAELARNEAERTFFAGRALACVRTSP
jgi:RNA polymerase sigma-70 factor (ECF subfamily)